LLTASRRFVNPLIGPTVTPWSIGMMTVLPLLRSIILSKRTLLPIITRPPAKLFGYRPKIYPNQPITQAKNVYHVPKPKKRLLTPFSSFGHTGKLFSTDKVVPHNSSLFDLLIYLKIT
jgi:hypothetical protein